MSIALQKRKASVVVGSKQVVKVLLSAASVEQYCSPSTVVAKVQSRRVLAQVTASLAPLSAAPVTLSHTPGAGVVGWPAASATEQGPRPEQKKKLQVFVANVRSSAALVPF